MKVIHLTGDTEDAGGILSLLRAIQPEFVHLRVNQSVWVNINYQEHRQPPLDYCRSKHTVGFDDNHARLIWSSIRSYFELCRLLKTAHFDVIHAHSQGSVLVAAMVNRLLGRAVVFTNHAYARRRGLYRWMSGFQDFHSVTLTPNMANYYGLQPNLRANWWVVSACCSSRFFESPLAEPSVGPISRVKMVGMGTLMRWKQWHLIVEALSQLVPGERSRLQIDIFGGRSNLGDSQEYADMLEADIARKGLQNVVHLRGMTSDVIGELRQADWFILPSTNEPCSVALIEALAIGLPAVVSASGGNVDIVRDGKSGRMFPPGEATGLAATLRSILQGSRPDCSPAAIRETVRSRSPEVVARKYLEIYHQALGHGASQESRLGRE